MPSLSRPNLRRSNFRSLGMGPNDCMKCSRMASYSLGIFIKKRSQSMIRTDSLRHWVCQQLIKNAWPMFRHFGKCWPPFRRRSNQTMETLSMSSGLIYVCLRNLAMAASWILCDVPDFSRYSPFNLETFEPCPISISEFECAMHCRMAGQRGEDPPPEADGPFVLALVERLEPWIDKLYLKLERNA